jgi:hypothetical protein
MAQNQFINLTADANASKRGDISNIGHSGGPAPAAAGDVTLSWDSAKIADLNSLRAAVQKMMSIAAGQMK